MSVRLLAIVLLAALATTLAAQEEIDTPQSQPGDSAPTETFGQLPQADQDSPPQPPLQTQPVQESAAEPSPEEVMQQLMADRPTAPVIAPISTSVPTPSQAAQAEPQVLGLAPDQGQPPLYREGEFIVSRPGRMVRAPSGQWLFQFEADSQSSPEAPVLLLPCQLLENMEDLARQRGDRLVFVLSGQIFTYHGRNWLLPSMMKLDVDRGNLQK